VVDVHVHVHDGLVRQDSQHRHDHGRRSAFPMGSGKVVAITALGNVLAHRQRLDAFLDLVREQYPCD
jgi:hypothetical protein